MVRAHIVGHFHETHRKENMQSVSATSKMVQQKTVGQTAAELWVNLHSSGHSVLGRFMITEIMIFKYQVAVTCCPVCSVLPHHPHQDDS